MSSTTKRRFRRILATQRYYNCTFVRLDDVPRVAIFVSSSINRSLHCPTPLDISVLLVCRAVPARQLVTHHLRISRSKPPRRKIRVGSGLRERARRDATVDMRWETPRCARFVTLRQFRRDAPDGAHNGGFYAQ